MEKKADSAKGGSHAGERLDKLLALVTELPRLLHAVLGVAVFLGLLGESLLLQLTNLLGTQSSSSAPRQGRGKHGDILASPRQEDVK